MQLPPAPTRPYAAGQRPPSRFGSRPHPRPPRLPGGQRPAPRPPARPIPETLTRLRQAASRPRRTSARPAVATRVRGGGAGGCQHRMPAAAVPIRFDPPYPSLTKSRPKDSCSPYGRYGWLHRITSAQLIRSPNCKHAFVSGSQILLLMTHVILVTTHQKISPLQFRCRCAAL